MNLDKFLKQFPNEKACLNYFKRRRYPDGVYRNVSKKHLQSYADEYAWRYSNRNSSVRMFELLLTKTAEV